MKITLTKAQAKEFVEGKAIKAKSATKGAADVEIKPGEFIDVTKDAAQAVRRARLAAEVSEKAAASALGFENVDDYVAFETGGSPLEVTAAGIKALSKTLKMEVAELAAQMLAGDSAAPENPDDKQPEPTGDGDPATPEKRAKLGKAYDNKTGLGSGPIIITPELMKSLGGTTDLEKAEKQSALFKALTGISDRVDLKKDIISPEMFAPNGVINPELATTLYDLTVAADPLMQKVQTRPMDSLMQEVLVWNVGKRTALRHTSGEWPTAGQLTEGINKSLEMTARKMNVYFKIDDRTLMNYKGNLAGLEQFIIQGFTKSFSRQILDLAFNGTTDTYADSFLSLGTGWITLAQSLTGARAVPANQIIDISAGAAALDTPYKVFDEMLLQAAEDPAVDYIDDSTPVICGSKFWRRHGTWIKSRPDALPVVLSGMKKEYDAHPVEVTSLLADNVAMITPYENLVIGIVTGNGVDGISVEKHRVPQATLFVCSVYVDFEFVNPQALILAKP